MFTVELLRKFWPDRRSITPEASKLLCPIPFVLLKKLDGLQPHTAEKCRQSLNFPPSLRPALSRCSKLSNLASAPVELGELAPQTAVSASKAVQNLQVNRITEQTNDVERQATSI